MDSSNLLGNNCTDVTKSNVVLTKSLLFMVGFWWSNLVFWFGLNLGFNSFIKTNFIYSCSSFKSFINSSQFLYRIEIGFKHFSMHDKYLSLIDSFDFKISKKPVPAGG